MRNAILIGLLLFAGCIGNPKPHNPIKEECSKDHTHPHKSLCIPLWWQLDTSQMKPKDNPWNKFLPVYKPVDTSDPWADFKEPQLFPTNWKPKAKRTKPTGSIKKFTPKVERDAKKAYKEMKKREREYFRRQRRKKRSI